MAVSHAHEIVGTRCNLGYRGMRLVSLGSPSVVELERITAWEIPGGFKFTLWPYSYSERVVPARSAFESSCREFDRSQRPGMWDWDIPITQSIESFHRNAALVCSPEHKVAREVAGVECTALPCHKSTVRC